ncbi:efflux RND transporter periplasmic adaptor subunit [Pseudomonas plecoglossicida]|mgnify:CR=1 FL=1|jgi:Cu(I)/Ag(I) efflux system membrane fusion protein|uniref:Efflux RND transporter periplasmic adaptor subunit n=15 Tax=Pseudomonas TaxID=286 RepID=A0A7W2QU29_9PSED|nr:MULTISPECIES: efflux RND transporter periplasmic adaptor subunit [Pseudomonas]AXQ46157.1 efflux RND transporter periplasmic adaptor subunit [Stenotrophomonas rhizophila]PPB14424.1 efflux RND transporter periplasmic adaptor subunit [Pseudomonas aeruginosa]WJM97511.1 efflux RND transporter periplasmic adaptor subunit [Pseudomonas defluvii]ABY95939.1 efflux transporter, RND family, MFP subunit [Pseudomonas putida GB-1]AGA70987.1 RND family efflux transporter MFP subunit [Pseudomonas putida HB3
MRNSTISLVVLAALAIGGGVGYQLAKRGQVSTASPETLQKVLYWYDPMYPQQHFPAPGKSPFMDMPLVPKYQESTAAEVSPAVQVSQGLQQNLGVRLATVAKGQLARTLQVSGVLTFDERDFSVLQARTGGYVERTYGRATGDVVAKGAPLADVLTPEWAGLQEEYLALQRSGDNELRAAARQRLLLAGMPADLINRIDRTGRVQNSVTLLAPTAGVLQALELRPGMTMTPGATLAKINGIANVWLEAAVPEAQAQGLQEGQAVQANLAAFPGEPVPGKLTALLADADLQSRTLRLRIELPNPGGRLRPGMTAQVSLHPSGQQDDSLLVPAEAIIRTGKRDLVMVSEDGGRFRPVEVVLGQESAGQVVVLRGLQAGQRVVASGQFLLDSEASLKGIEAVTAGDAPLAQPVQPALHQANGRIVQIEGNQLTIAHGPFVTLGMPGMTMTFPVADPRLIAGLKVGERIRFGVRERDEGMVIEQITQQENQP